MKTIVTLKRAPGRLFAGPAALFTLFLAGSAVAADTTPMMMNIHGHVETLDKNDPSITVRTKDNVRRKVIYSGDTKFLYGHSKSAKPGSPEQVKASNYISCAGTYNGKMELKAKECVYR